MSEQTDNRTERVVTRALWLGLPVLLGSLLLVAVVLLAVSSQPRVAYADPIDPPQGYPKFLLSVKTVTPTLAHTGGVTLYYGIEIRNTGAFTAAGTTVVDALPEGASYNGDAEASVPGTFEPSDGTLTWQGDVGFDSTVLISFTVSVPPTLTGLVRNTAVISHPLIARPVTLTAETMVTDQPILTIEKTAVPPKPGANKPLTYTIMIANQGQPAVNLPITVIDWVPLSTTLRSIGSDGSANPAGSVVTWTRSISLELGDTTFFTFSVNVGDVPSGTVIANEGFRVASPYAVTAGEPYTVTVVDPIFWLSKHVWPDPPGSNREMTYTLTLLNAGSLATNLVITDRVPAGVEYRRGGSLAAGVVSWTLPSLNTGEWAEFTFAAYVSDVMGVPIVNHDYGVCCAEGVCLTGEVLTSVVAGPTFEVSVFLDPFVHKPGGGIAPTTPTLVVRNLGPGNALAAEATLRFYRISVSFNDLRVIPPVGELFPGPECGNKCVAYAWVGDIGHGEAITFTTEEGQSTIGGAEGTHYTATIVVSDSLANMSTEPVSGTAIGLITHKANLLPSKYAPPVIGAGQLMTYSIRVFNSALSTDDPLQIWLTDTVPLSTTVVRISDGGVTRTLTDTTVISWALPALSTGDELYRSFTVLVDGGLLSGTQILNNDYHASWYEAAPVNAILSNAGEPVTTTVREVGLIDSYKEVTPTLTLPGEGRVLTYSLHIVNSSPVPLTGVTLYDFSPWESSTYQRDAVVSAGQLISDIVSIRWSGDVAAFSSEVVTFTVVVDPGFEGPITNTAVISHPSLSHAVVVEAVAYVTDRPLFRITKSATPDPVQIGEELAYAIRVVNLGQKATGVVITDAIPADTEYVAGSATIGAKLADGQVRWELPVLELGESRAFGFRVRVGVYGEVVNDQYAVTCLEGVTRAGVPVITRVQGGRLYLPLIFRYGP